ncbi:hypothetical protein [Jannaschia sp. W003]|uniref:hypothetical protein n=1 Tax=Jannaschia sp. W003 TaxID=2867012 RepID=UPI0021A7ACD9|nr:hypothetical protein [Jannaschia sp. W003]UWQ20116.1 hypothetical protein K3554_08850 [Jannaschia sp. W003]
MARETNETFPRGTRADPMKARKGWGRRLLRAVFRIVWVIDKAFRLIAWLSGGDGG